MNIILYEHHTHFNSMSYCYRRIFGAALGKPSRADHLLGSCWEVFALNGTAGSVSDSAPVFGLLGSGGGKELRVLAFRGLRV